MKIDYIFVPQGQEYQRIKKGFNLAKINRPVIVAIPVGPQGVNLFLEKWLIKAKFHHHRILLMGLGGSLSPQYSVGAITLYENCGYLAENCFDYEVKLCDGELNCWLQNNLNLPSYLVKGLTSDRLINLAREKQEIFKKIKAEVIDMEGWTILNLLEKINVKLSILRVISDDVNYNIPDLNSAFTSQGKLKPFDLTLGLLADPLGGWRLIQGSLKALNQLEKVAFDLAQILRHGGLDI
jgi:nucleoside phosphorylase